MIIPQFFYRFNYKVSAFMIGFLCFVIACGLFAEYAFIFRMKKDTALALGSELSSLRSHVAVLQSTVDAEQVFASQALASREEQAEVYILPDHSPATRLAEVTPGIVRVLAGGSGTSLRFVRQSTGPVSTFTGSLRSQKVSLTVEGVQEKVIQLISILGMGGNLMIRDALTPQARQKFLQFIEQSTPESLKDASNFFYSDLLLYAEHPDAVEQRYLHSIPPDLLISLRKILLAGGLSSVRFSLSRYAAVLSEQRLWPLPLLRIDSIERVGDSTNIGATVFQR